MDLASCHKSAAEYAKKLFKRGVILQSPTSPEFNLLDAAVFPFMERMQQQAGALSLEDIRKSTFDAFELITPELCTKAANRVRANMRVVVKKQGGNWFVEHRQSEYQPEASCCRCGATYTGEGESALVLCDKRGCMSGVHNRCLGRKTVPLGKFFCDSHK